MQKQIVRQSTSPAGRVLLVAHVQNSEQLFEHAQRLIRGGGRIVEQNYTNAGLWSKAWIVLQPAREAIQMELI